MLTIHTAAGKSPNEGPQGRQFIANAVGAALLLDPETEAREEPAGLSAWASRGPVNQAVGMVVAQLGVPPDDALALLRAHAFARDADLATVAGETIERRVDLSNFQVSGD
ncbi:MAG: ANTAR domain-containing protein [Actinomycetota bacterium]|nr:ANTAR domain-containing protein [Actinomycetota bacterium]